MKMVQIHIKSLNIDEFLKLAQTKPASEFINGQIIKKTMPQGKHSAIKIISSKGTRGRYFVYFH